MHMFTDLVEVEDLALLISLSMLKTGVVEEGGFTFSL